jgi:hypothetical protein
MPLRWNTPAHRAVAVVGWVLIVIGVLGLIVYPSLLVLWVAMIAFGIAPLPRTLIERLRRKPGLGTVEQAAPSDSVRGGGVYQRQLDQGPASPGAPGRRSRGDTMAHAGRATRVRSPHGCAMGGAGLEPAAPCV